VIRRLLLVLSFSLLVYAGDLGSSSQKKSIDSSKDSNLLLVGLSSGVGVGTDTLINSTGTKSNSFTILPQASLLVGYRYSGIDIYSTFTDNIVNNGALYLRGGVGAKYDVLDYAISFGSMKLAPMVSIEQQLTYISGNSLSFLGWGNTLGAGVVLKSDYLDVVMAYNYDLVFWDFPIDGIMDIHNNHLFVITLNYYINL